MEKISRSIALLGGTFDPVHNGHIEIARMALKSLPVEKILFIPAKIPPHKQDSVLLPADIRLKILESVIQHYPHFEVWNGEYKRNKPSYTIDTLRIIKEEKPYTKLFFIIGSDNLVEIKTWHRYTELLKEVEFAVTVRPGYPTEVPTELKNAKLTWFKSPHMAISSTEIRKKIRSKQNYANIVPKEIYNFLESMGSYSAK